MSNQNNITIKDVAREAGVSIATVSRYMNEGTKVSGGKRKIVKETAERLGYKPNEEAQRLGRMKNKRSRQCKSE